MANPRPEHFQSDSSIFVALARLSLGLEHVHNFVTEQTVLEKIGCHHDLKPDNIFLDNQSFVLADFGLSTFKDTSQDSKTQRKVGGTSYSAPECENIADPVFARGRAGRKGDIWAFGCIMAEMLTYVLKGSEGVKVFKERRTFTILGFTLSNFHKGTSPNPEVETWLSNLEIDANVPRKALVRLIRRMLQMDPDDRPSAKDVSIELQAIALQERTYPIDQLFDMLKPKVTEEETAILFVEYARYKGWKEACGITPDVSRDTTGGLQGLQFDGCLDALSHYQDTLEQILDRLCDNNRMHLLLPLRYSNSRLEQLFPLEMRVDLQSRLAQRTVVSIEDLPLLAKTHGVLQSDRANLATSELAKVKLMTEAAREYWNTPNGGPRLYIDLKSIHLHTDLEHHSLGLIKTPADDTHRSVLVEWLRYGTYVLPETEAVQRAQRVEAVARLLNSIPHPPGFRLLRCSNFFHDPENSRFGLVFELPFPVHAGEEPSKDQGITTLSKLLARSKDDHDLKMPSLGQRFRLAQTLASAIGEFHKVGWLHRKISPHNVVFPQIDGCPDYENPYLIGFSHSRPNSPNEFTEGPGQQHQNYQHPEYIKKPQRYRAEFDFYSLGIILLEIARWQLVDHFTRGKAWQLLDEAKFRLALIKEARSESLAHKVGTQYCQAATTCLLGHDELAVQEESSDGSEDAAGLFQLRVISGLAKCSA
jgi:serine/threonine protein kinase